MNRIISKFNLLLLCLIPMLWSCDKDTPTQTETRLLPAGKAVATMDVPGKPTNLTGTATHAAVSLTWDAPSTGADSYEVRRRRPGVDAVGTLHVMGTSTTTSYTDKTVEPETEYGYRVWAINTAGKGKRSAIFKVETPAEPEEETRQTNTIDKKVSSDEVSSGESTLRSHHDDPPDQTIALSFNALGGASHGDPVILSWEIHEDNYLGLTGFVVERIWTNPIDNRCGGACPEITIFAQQGTRNTGFTDRYAPGGYNSTPATYRYTLKGLVAENGMVASNPDTVELATDQVSIPSRPEFIPSVPSGLSVSNSRLSIQVSWNKIDDAPAYLVQWREDAGPSHGAASVFPDTYSDQAQTKNAWRNGPNMKGAVVDSFSKALSTISINISDKDIQDIGLIWVRVAACETEDCDDTGGWAETAYYVQE